MGRGGGRGEIPDSVVVVYGYGEGSESDSLPPERNGDDSPLIGMQILDRPERGARGPRSQSVGGTGERDGLEAQEDRERDVIYKEGRLGVEWEGQEGGGGGNWKPCGDGWKYTEGMG